LIKQDPKSIWADDAQYIISVLSIENKSKQAEELEYLLKEYPDFHIEDWTKTNLGLLIPSNISPYLARLELCMLYKEIGDTEKLKISCEEGIKAYPEKADKFEKILGSLSKN
jgi:hypothetical protein